MCKKNIFCLFRSSAGRKTLVCYNFPTFSIYYQTVNADNAKTGQHNDIISTHHQSFPTNGKVALVADVDGDGAKELIIASTDRVVRVFKWVREETQKGVHV